MLIYYTQLLQNKALFPFLKQDPQEAKSAILNHFKAHVALQTTNSNKGIKKAILTPNKSIIFVYKKTPDWKTGQVFLKRISLRYYFTLKAFIPGK